MIKKLNHFFVDTIPDELEENTLYISLKFRVIMHSCCCGCKNKVVTPLSPARWKMIFDGKTISLLPSIGNWNFDCKSHYWITKSEVDWASEWTEDEIIEGKACERARRAEYFKKTNEEFTVDTASDKEKIVRTSFLEKIKRIFGIRN